MFENYLETLFDPQADPVAAGLCLRELAEASVEKAPQLINEIGPHVDKIAAADPAILGGLIRLLHINLLQPGNQAVEELNLDAVLSIERNLPPAASNRHLMLQWLAMMRTSESIGRLAQRLIDQPPNQWMEAAQVLSPLMRSTDWPIDSFYPSVLDAIEHPSLASPLLDLANYLFRENRVATHPATDRLEMLNQLLGEVGNRLSRFEEDPRVFGDDVDQVQTRLGEAVALAVSLCDCVGLLGDPSSIGKLNTVLDLKHRRVQCEAAGALARLGEDEGQKRLIELTTEPVARLRAIHYADELGFGDFIEETVRSEESIAEAEVALWLSQPQQMGVPPTGVEVVHRKRMLWPSFQDPIDVFLVRFEYNFGERVYSNVAMTGPATFAMSADVADLPEADIYAIYAGWQAEHPEIFSVAPEQFNEAQVRIMQQLADHLARSEYESTKPLLVGIFLDEKAGVFSATRDNKPCIVITDGLETIDQPTSGRLRPLGAGDLFNLYKGRKMLRTFNPTADD